MAVKLHPATFLITQNQVNWLEEESERTGLNKVEIVRRALDDYKEAEETKEQRRFFTPQQRQEIREIARLKGVTELQVIRAAIDRELRFMMKVFEKRSKEV